MTGYSFKITEEKGGCSLVININIAQEVKQEIGRMIGWMGEQKLNDQQIEAVVSAILNTQDDKQNNINKIFVAGLGRSGFVARAFAMRLAHLAYSTWILGDPTAPPLERGDLFVVISGSGKSLKRQIETAIDIGAVIIVATSVSNSIDARLADKALLIPGREKEEKEGVSMGYEERQMRGLPKFPLGTAFEDFAMIVLDAIVSTIMEIRGKSEKDLQSRHANLDEQ